MTWKFPTSCFCPSNICMLQEEYAVFGMKHKIVYLTCESHVCERKRQRIIVEHLQRSFAAVQVVTFLQVIHQDHGSVCGKVKYF